MNKDIYKKFDKLANETKDPSKKGYIENLKNQWYLLDTVSDEELSIINANAGKAYASDSVYEKLDENDPIREKIVRRELKEKEYNKLEKELAITQFPSQIRGLSVLSGTSEKKLNNLAMSYSLDLEGLKKVTALKKKYQTNYDLIERLFSKDLDINGVDNFLSAKSTLEDYYGGKMSSNVLFDFMETFGSAQYLDHNGVAKINGEDLYLDVIKINEAFEESEYWKNRLKSKRMPDNDPNEIHEESKEENVEYENKAGAKTTLKKELRKTGVWHGNLIWLESRLKMAMNIAKERGYSDLESVMMLVKEEDEDFMSENCREDDFIDYIENIVDK
jgi:hypothetical protein